LGRPSERLRKALLERAAVAQGYAGTASVIVMETTDSIFEVLGQA
jgi:hypothetical protein